MAELVSRCPRGKPAGEKRGYVGLLVFAAVCGRVRARAPVARLVDDAIRQGLILINPAALVKLPSGARPKALVWTP